MNKEKQDQFLMIPYKLLRAVGYVKPDGECVKMTLTEKIIYAHIKNRFEFFKSLGKEYYDTQQAIADVCSMDVKSVGKIIRTFMEKGLVEAYKKRFNGFPKNVYTKVPHLVLYYKDKGVVTQEYVDNYEYPEMPSDFVVDMFETVEINNFERDFDYDSIPDWAK